MFIKKILTRNSLKFKDCYTLKSNTKKAKLKYAISLADRLINYPDKSSIKTDLSQIWKLSGLSENEFNVLFIKTKGVDILKYCRDKDTDCKC